MASFDEFILNVRRAETPFYARLKRIGKGVLGFQIRAPRFALSLFRALAALDSLSYELHERLAVVLYRYPVTQAFCKKIGPGLELEFIPGISGGVEVYLGSNVRLSGRVAIAGARVFEKPTFKVGDRVFIGSGFLCSVAKEVVIEDDVLISSECVVSDYSGHPTDPKARIAGVQVDPSEVRPVRICRNAWVGRRVIILPGVTIGEGAIIGAGAVVTKSVPPHQLCVGNPGRIVTRTFGEEVSNTHR